MCYLLVRSALLILDPLSVDPPQNEDNATAGEKSHESSNQEALPSSSPRLSTSKKRKRISKSQHPKCRYCQKVFTSGPQMVKHHHLMDKCVEYGNPTNKERALQRETQLCYVCGHPYPVTGTRQEGFRVKRQVFNGHIQKHLPPGAELCYKCPQCSRSFADSPALKSHLLLKHSVGEKKVQHV